MLIVGATGGVGGFAVQLAATVIAPALSEDEDYLRDLGVTEVLPREGDVAAAVRERFADGVAALLDLEALHALASSHTQGKLAIRVS